MKENTVISFTGDIGFDSYMNGRWEDPGLISSDILDFIRGSDHVVVNVEGAIAGEEIIEKLESRTLLFHSIDPRSTAVLQNMGADIWNLANNHIMDVGAPGLESTLSFAKSCGAETIGAGMNVHEARKPVILEEAGGIGLIGIGYQRACRKASEDQAGCFSWSDDEGIKDAIKKIKKECRWCIVVSHGGEEFTPLPSPYTRKRYIDILNMGADTVVSHHPHVPMNYETVGGKTIFYSLGNFIFDTDYQRSQHYTDKGIVLKMHFSETSYEHEAIGIRINRDNETVERAELPDIYTEVGEEEYEKLMPLSVKAFLEATKRQQRFLFPDKYADADEALWRENFMEPKRSGRVPGEALDFHILCPLAEEAGKGKWKESRLEQVKKYILKQMEPV